MANDMSLPRVEGLGLLRAVLRVDWREWALRLVILALGAGLGVGAGFLVEDAPRWAPLLGGWLVATVALVGFTAGMLRASRGDVDGVVKAARRSARGRDMLRAGQPAAAVIEFEMAVAAAPAEPDAYVHVGRLLRDELGRAEEALTWFKRARRDAAIAPADEMVIAREIAETLLVRTEDAERAIPELARLVELFGGTPAGVWARRELDSLREKQALALLATLEERVAENPADAASYLEIGRLLRDQLGRADEGREWFERARREASLTPNDEMVVGREIIETALKHGGDKSRTIPELVRLVDRFPNTPTALWAFRELHELRQAGVPIRCSTI